METTIMGYVGIFRYMKPQPHSLKGRALQGEEKRELQPGDIQWSYILIAVYRSRSTCMLVYLSQLAPQQNKIILIHLPTQINLMP